MSTSPDMSSFGKFIPGFDFLQNLSKQSASGATASDTQSLMPNLTSWIAPTLNEEELNKRIDELKAVQFWLDQNATALKATIQALEVQKMTLSALKSMNFNFGGAATDTQDQSKDKKSKSADAAKVDALQWWNALTKQFGEIATKTIQEAAEKAAKSPLTPATTPAAKTTDKKTSKPAAKKAAIQSKTLPKK